MAQKPRAKAGRPRFFARVDPLTSLRLVFPLFWIYEVGVLFIPRAYNGVDIITAEIERLLHGRLPLYIGLNAALCVLFVGAVFYFRGKHQFEPRRFWSVLAESTVYALTMGSLICFVMVDLLHVDPRLSLAPVAHAGGAAPTGPLAGIIVALGAGVHEELVFRVLLLGGVVAFLNGPLKVRRGIAVAIGFVVSSVLFSAAHHIIGGEPFRMGAFVYRVLCGLFFASLYEWRGLAIAVYTHALYDIYVFLLR
jgi:hypothetical protein